MTPEMKNEKLAAMMLSPFQFFQAPMDVTRDPDLSKEEKLTILRSMDQDARELQVAAEENMAGGETPPLEDVRRAIRVLDPEAADRAEKTVPSKHGFN